MLLSIIVPVYNVEAFLEKCINSILEQDLAADEYEIILVDDGSTDSSGHLCDEIASVSPNIIVIHKENGGLSSARNAGIDKATGKYIQFVDSDDYLNPNVLGSLLSQIERDRLDVLRFNYQNVNSQGKVFEPNKFSKPFVDYSPEICNGLTFLNERLGYACYAVQFILRTELVRSPSNHFKEGILFEDVEWTPRMLLQADRVASTDLMVYNYLFRTGSITRDQGTEKKQRILDNQFHLIDCMIGQAEKVQDKRWFKGMIAQTSLAVINSVSVFFYRDRKVFLDKLKKKDLFPLSTYHATSNAKRKILIANLSPRFLCLLLHYNHK